MRSQGRDSGAGLLQVIAIVWRINLHWMQEADRGGARSGCPTAIGRQPYAVGASCSCVLQVVYGRQYCPS